jgi:tetratricopeptide (TPR) repeat protein
MTRTVEALIDRAWDAPAPPQRAMFARQALALDPATVDAYVVLASCVETPAERIALLREGVRRGEFFWRQYLKRPPKEFFWAHFETRPFMRALHNLALTLWECGDREEAALLTDRMLRLNPNDNQGMRYLALAWHPVLGNWSRVDALLKKYKGEGRTEYLYAYCLNCLRQGADAEEALEAAMAANPHVPPLLLAARPPPPDSTAPSTAFGSHEEAAAYAAFNREAWAAVPLALGWLRGALRRRRG